MVKVKKAVKDKLTPKKPLNAYTLFVSEMRSGVTADNPELSFQEIAAMVGEMWHNLPKNYKKRYVELAEQDKERYFLEKRIYKAHLLSEPESLDLFAKRKRAGQTKNPLSAFTFFSKEMRHFVSQQDPSLDFRGVSVRVGQLWKQLSEQEREKYFAKADQDKARYENERMDWENKVLLEKEEENQKLAKMRKKLSRPKNPLSAYTFFVMEKRATLTNRESEMSFKQVALELGKRWRSLKPEERLVYDKRALKDKERFAREKALLANKEKDTFEQE